MKVLVTGGGGFIGSHLIDALLAAGHEARVLDNFATGRRENLLHVMNEIEVVEGDIQSYERVYAGVRGCDVVLHQAALPSVPRSIQDPLTSNASNVIGTLNVLLAARDSGIRRVVFASSSSVYGADKKLPKTEGMAPAPISPYGVAKLAAEAYCRSFSEVYGLETVSLRYFNVFGPRQDPLSQYAAVIPSFITAAAGGRPVRIFGDGEQSRDFTYIRNVVDANLLAAEAPDASGRVFNVACGQRTTLNQLVKEIGDLMGHDIEKRHESSRPGEIRHSLADVSLAHEALGYTPAVSLPEGLGLTITHYREVGLLPGTLPGGASSQP